MTSILKTAFLSFLLVAIGCGGESQSSRTKQAEQATGQETVAFTMYKNASCGCCAKWADHMERHSFEVTEEAVTNLNEVKDEMGVPQHLRSCHTAKIGGYIVEGHVPAADVKRLLREQPDAKGLTVPNMPVGSPGMEVPGRPADSYQVLLITNSGETEVFSQY